MALRDTEKNILAVYDVADPNRLRMVAKIAEAHGKRVQKSVFELHLRPTILAEMHRQVNRVIDSKRDSVRYYPLCVEDWQTRQVSGQAEFLPEDWKEDFIIL